MGSILIAMLYIEVAATENKSSGVVKRLREITNKIWGSQSTQVTQPLKLKSPTAPMPDKNGNFMGQYDRIQENLNLPDKGWSNAMTVGEATEGVTKIQVPRVASKRPRRSKGASKRKRRASESTGRKRKTVSKPIEIGSMPKLHEYEKAETPFDKVLLLHRDYFLR